MTENLFCINRRYFAESMKFSLVVDAAYSQVQRGNDAAFGFEQESNFWYLTGIDAPDWWLVMAGSKSWLVAPDIDPVHQVFNGSLSWQEAKKISGVDKVISRDESERLLRDLARKYRVVHTIGPDPRAKHYDFNLNPAPAMMRRKLKRIFSEVRDCRSELAKLRAIKQPEEIEAIRLAVGLTVENFKAVKQKLPDLKYEYEVEAEFTYGFRKSGARGHAYDPIVASGQNACTLHYNANDDPLEAGSLLLLDIGARVDGYAADISRTYAVGQPTQRQVAVHKAVESASREIISLLKPGLIITEYSERVDQIMKAKLTGLGLLQSVDDYRKYFPHAISHGLGIDVHDSLGGPSELLPGMVLTVEPGIYIPEEGIGVRIEDDILITKDGHENLSAALSTAL